MARLVLVGMPGVGKTTVARALGENYQCDVVDTDELVAERVAEPVERFLRERGEPAFREVELVALRDALDRDAVVATGAGVVTVLEARRLLERESTVWLDCTDEELLARVLDGDRPLLGADVTAGLARLRAQRERWYRDCSFTRVDASGSLEDVVARIRNVAPRVES